MLVYDYILKCLYCSRTTLDVCQRLALNKDVNPLLWSRPPPVSIHSPISSPAARLHIHAKGPEQRYNSFFVLCSPRDVAGERGQRPRGSGTH